MVIRRAPMPMFPAAITSTTTPAVKTPARRAASRSWWIAALVSDRNPRPIHGVARADSPTSASTAVASPGAARKELATMKPVPRRHLRIDRRSARVVVVIGGEPRCLQVEQLGVAAALTEQPVVVALLDEAAVLEHAD